MADEADEEVVEDAAAAAAAARNAGTTTSSSTRCVRTIRALSRSISTDQTFSASAEGSTAIGTLRVPTNDGSPFVFLRCHSS